MPRRILRKILPSQATLRDRWFLQGDMLTEAEQHFVVAILIRGGVFSEKEE